MLWMLLVLLSPIIIVAGMMLFFEVMKIAMKHPDKFEKMEKIYNRFKRKKRK